eukprot:maker-scaffold161_size295871-snap-gene-1.36 protein:Tk05107 transcript:maker-scaffold161_size295871-snap-gene-1.36-mRNA-1 annotation:"cysteine-rich motor neuron 1 protein"
MWQYICLVAILALSLDQSQSLSCIPCNVTPCETPACCESGTFTSAVCGCCQVCAKPENDSCGGPWRTSGVCGDGLSCYRRCECRTTTGRDCIFPFTFKGQTFTECTTFESLNEKPWCAVAVDENNEALEGQWADCSDGCPGTAFPCDDGQLFNMDGVCVNQTERERIEQGSILRAPKITYQFDDGTVDPVPAPVCSVPIPGTATPAEEHCRCAQDDDCVPLNQETLFPATDGGKAYCFLEYVHDPTDPSQNCFQDAQWSKSAGRFWSNEACAEKPKELELELELIDAKKEEAIIFNEST